MEPADLGMLVTLDALLQEGSVTRAARRVGLSTPAMSHALARIRERMKDPILVRSGRGMVLTPRAESLKPRIHAIVESARGALEPERPFVARELERTFVILASDYVLGMLGVQVDAILRSEAPGVGLRFVPNSPDDPTQLREGGADLAVGIYGDLPPEMRSRVLLTDRFVAVMRSAHPLHGKRLTLDHYLRLDHIQVAPRGKPGGYIDELLRERGQARRVARAVPYFMAALQLVAQTDYVLTISERIAQRHAAALALELREVPLELRPYALSLVWHPRLDAEPSHRFLREVFVRAARLEAGDQHPSARRMLDAGDPTSGQPRRRARKRRA